jgi:hypothetical protein
MQRKRIQMFKQHNAGSHWCVRPLSKFVFLDKAGICSKRSPFVGSGKLSCASEARCSGIQLGHNCVQYNFPFVVLTAIRTS